MVSLPAAAFFFCLKVASLAQKKKERISSLLIHSALRFVFCLLCCHTLRLLAEPITRPFRNHIRGIRSPNFVDPQHYTVLFSLNSSIRNSLSDDVSMSIRDGPHIPFILHGIKGPYSALDLRSLLPKLS